MVEALSDESIKYISFLTFELPMRFVRANLAKLFENALIAQSNQPHIANHIEYATKEMHVVLVRDGYFC